MECIGSDKPSKSGWDNNDNYDRTYKDVVKEEVDDD
jgi:hypothetical protein